MPFSRAASSSAATSRPPVARHCQARSFTSPPAIEPAASSPRATPSRPAARIPSPCVRGAISSASTPTATPSSTGIRGLPRQARTCSRSMSIIRIPTRCSHRSTRALRLVLFRPLTEAHRAARGRRAMERYPRVRRPMGHPERAGLLRTTVCWRWESPSGDPTHPGRAWGWSPSARLAISAPAPGSRDLSRACPARRRYAAAPGRARSCR